MKRILDYAPAVRNNLENLLKERTASAPNSPLQVDALERLRPFATGGKLLRGSLICFSYEACSGAAPTAAVMQAATALELVHSGLLIHDDIMDKDALRRGQPAIHEQYRQEALEQQLADAEHFGLSLGMTTGDIGLFLAFELLGTLDESAGIKDTLARLFWRQLQITCAGQMQDLYLEAKNTEPSRQTLYDLMEAKTAAYTIALPLAMGAVLAGDAPETIKKLRTFGVNTGLIFQIRDDELGVMGDSNRTGKPIDSDIREGKKTLLRYYLFEQCDAAERARLKTIFGNSRASAADIAYVRELVKSKGVSRLLEADVANLESKARETLKTLQLPAAAHKELEWLVAFCAQRTV